VGQAARRYRDELWRARKEPMVGVFVDFDHEALWAAVSTMGRDKFKHVPVQARIGASRALIDHNVPWEYVTATDLRKGLAARYEAIYLPAVLALGTDLLEILSDYVEGGGRLVMDMPSAWYDQYGRLLPTGEGTVFERTFGCSIRDFQYSSNVPRSIDGRTLEGFVVDLGVTHAQVLAEYNNGQPAVTQAEYGKGKALLLGYESSLLCFRPGNDWAERRLVKYALEARHRPFACDGAIVYRLAAPEADHYFLINDGPATTVQLDTRKLVYENVVDAVTGEELELGGAIDLPAHDGRWLRFGK
jgi:beta-galactosidase